MSKGPKFLPGYVLGEYLAEEIDDFIAQWHEDKPKIALREYLGFNDDEWDIWIMDGSTLGQIAIARERKISVAEQLMSIEDYALAARSDRPVEAERILDWLKKNGYI